MKTMLASILMSVGLIVLATSTPASAQQKSQAKDAPVTTQTQKQICDDLDGKMNEDCAHLMCDDMIADGTFTDMDACTQAPDYGEAAQAACEEQPTLEDLVADYNTKNPGQTLACE